jgi:hypothetical protein
VNKVVKNLELRTKVSEQRKGERETEIEASAFERSPRCRVL